MYEWDTPEFRAHNEREYARIRAKHPELVTVSFECYVGWFGIIERYFDEVARLLAEHPGAEFKARQVKEKFAGLRLYSQSSEDISGAVHEAYQRAAAEADRTCEICGGEGQLRRRGYAWMTRCAEHADGGEPTTWDAAGEPG